MDKKSGAFLLFVLVIALLANIFTLLFCNRLLNITVQQNKEIKQLEYELEYVCEKL